MIVVVSVGSGEAAVYFFVRGMIPDSRRDLVAKGIVEGLQKIGNIKIPVVVRLRGANADEGIRILNASPLKFTVAPDFGEAAKKAVELAGKGGG